MLGRIVPGRLPSTVADIKLLDQRIAFNKKQLSMLPQKVAQGLLSERDAGYRKLYLQGEIEQLIQAKRNRRYATPSYRTPLDVFESTRRGAPANKYTAESNGDGLPAGYFGDDNGSNGGSISSDWNQNIEDFDVPDISVPPGPVQDLWPAHWPGNHSPAITKAVMDAGKVNGVQLVNPKKDPEYRIATTSLENGIKVLAQYEALRDHVKSTTGYTPSDGVLVSQIETKVRNYVETAKSSSGSNQATVRDVLQNYRGYLLSLRKQDGQEVYAITGVDNQTYFEAVYDPNQPRPTKTMFENMVDDKLQSDEWPPQGDLVAGVKRNARDARRAGNLMGLGALQAHDRASFLTKDQGMTPTQRKSYLQAEREMALAKKRAGSKVSLTQQLREEPITRPWQIQVSLSTAALNSISTRLNQQLAAMNLSQEMFTQQMHTHVAAVINSMPSGMAPSEQAEMIIERVMATATNSSGLLKKDVKVDINRGSTSPLTFSSAESLSGVVGSLSGTRAALGRLLR